MEIVEVHKLFFELLLVTVGEKDSLSRTPLEDEWVYLLEEAYSQSIGGVMLSGLEKLTEEQRPSKWILLRWILAKKESKHKKHYFYEGK